MATNSYLPDIQDMVARALGVKKAALPKMLPNTNIDYQAIAAQLARDQQRGQELAKSADNISAGEMVSGHYVPNWGGMLAGMGKAIMGGAQERSAGAQLEQIAAQRAAREQEAIGALPFAKPATPGVEEVGPPRAMQTESPSGDIMEVNGPAGVVGAMGPQPVTPEMIQKFISQYGDTGMGRAAAAKFADRTLDAAMPDPEKVEARQLARDTAAANIEQRKLEAELRHKADMANVQQRADAAERRSEDTRLSIAERERAAKEANDLKRELAKMVAATKSAGAGGGEKWTDSGNVDNEGRKILYDKTDPTKTMVMGVGGAATGPGMPKSSFEKAAAAADASKASRDATDRLLKEGETIGQKAFSDKAGMASNLPTNFLSSRATNRVLTPEQQTFRSEALRMSAQETHALYGAALTKGESDRARTFIVQSDDPWTLVQSKLQGIRKLQTEVQERLAREGARRSGATAPTAPTAPAAGKNVTVDF